jgi:hypothetical protein
VLTKRGALRKQPYGAEDCGGDGFGAQDEWAERCEVPACVAGGCDFVVGEATFGACGECEWKSGCEGFL